MATVTVTVDASAGSQTYGSEGSGSIKFDIDGGSITGLQLVSISGSSCKVSYTTDKSSIYLKITPSALSGSVSWSAEVMYSASDESGSAEKSGTISWTASKASISLPSLSSAGFTYNGSSQGPTVSYDSTLCEKSGTESATDVGKYSVTVSIKDTSYYQWEDGKTTSKILDWLINKIVIDKVSFSGTSFTYNGNLLGPSHSGGESGVTISDNTATNVGSYEAKASLDDKTHTEWEGGGTSDITKSWTISKASNSISISTDTVDKTCGDSSFTRKGSATWGTVTYSSSDSSVASVDSSSGLVSIGKGGSATITASVAGTDNYDEASSSYSVKVTKKSGKVTLSTLKKSVAIGEYFGIAAYTSNSSGSVSWYSEDSTIASVTKDANGDRIVKGIKVGTTKIIAELAETDYSSGDSAACEVGVEKAKQYSTQPVDGADRTYTGETMYYNMANPLFAKPSGDLSGQNVGRYCVTWTLYPDTDEILYLWGNGGGKDPKSVYWEITKATPNITGLDTKVSQGVSMNWNLTDKGCDASTDFGTIAYKSANTDVCTYSSGIISGVGYGDTTATAYVAADSENGNWCYAEKKISVHIDRTSGSISWVPALTAYELKYNSSALSVGPFTAASGGSGTTITYSRASGDAGLSVNSDDRTIGVTAGKVPDTTPYNISITATSSQTSKYTSATTTKAFTVKVNKLTASLSLAPSDLQDDWTYDTTSKAACEKAGSANLNCAVKYIITYTDMSGAVTTLVSIGSIPTIGPDAGTYLVEYQAVAADGYSAYIVDGDILTLGTVTVSKRDPEITTLPVFYSGDFDRAWHDMVVTEGVAGIGSTLQYSTDEKTWETTIPTTWTIYSGNRKIYYKPVRDVNASANNMNAEGTEQSGRAYTNAITPDWIFPDSLSITLVSGDGGTAGSIEVTGTDSGNCTYTWVFENDWESWLSTSSTKPTASVTYKRPLTSLAYKSGLCSVTVSSTAVPNTYKAKTSTVPIDVRKKAATLSVANDVFYLVVGNSATTTLSGTNSGSYTISEDSGFSGSTSGNTLTVEGATKATSAGFKILSAENAEYYASPTVQISGECADAPSASWIAVDKKVDEVQNISCVLTFLSGVSIQIGSSTVIKPSRDPSSSAIDGQSYSGDRITTTLNNAGWKISDAEHPEVTLLLDGTVNFTLNSHSFAYEIPQSPSYFISETITILRNDLPWELSINEITCYAGNSYTNGITVGTTSASGNKFIMDNAEAYYKIEDGGENQEHLGLKLTKINDEAKTKEYNIESVLYNRAYNIDTILVHFYTKPTLNYNEGHKVLKVIVVRNPAPEWFFSPRTATSPIEGSVLTRNGQELLKVATNSTLKSTSSCCLQSISEYTYRSGVNPITFSYTEFNVTLNATSNNDSTGAVTLYAKVQDSANYYEDATAFMYAISTTDALLWSSTVTKLSSGSLIYVNSAQACKTSFSVYGIGISLIQILSCNLVPDKGSVSNVTNSVSTPSATLNFNYTYDNSDTGGTVGTPIITNNLTSSTSVSVRVTYETQNSAGAAVYYTTDITRSGAGSIPVYKYTPSEWGFTSSESDIYGIEPTTLTITGTPTSSMRSYIQYKKSTDSNYTDLTEVSSGIGSYTFKLYDDDNPKVPIATVDYYFRAISNGTTNYYPYSSEKGNLVDGHDRKLRNLVSSPADGYYEVYKGSSGKTFNISGAYAGGTVTFTNTNSTIITPSWALNSGSTTEGVLSLALTGQELDQDTATITAKFPIADTYKPQDLQYSIKVIKVTPGWTIDYTPGPSSRSINAGGTFGFKITGIPTDGGYTADDFTITADRGTITKGSLTSGEISVTYENTHGVPVNDDFYVLNISVSSREKNKYYSKNTSITVNIYKKSDDFTFTSITGSVNLNRNDTISGISATLSASPKATGEGSQITVSASGVKGSFDISRSETSISASASNMSNSDAGKYIYLTITAVDNFYKRRTVSSGGCLLKGYQGGNLYTYIIPEGLRLNYDVTTHASGLKPQGTITNVIITPAVEGDTGLTATWVGSTITFTATSTELQESRNYAITVEMSGNTNYQAGTVANGGEWRFNTVVKVYRNLKIWDNSNSWKIAIPYYFDSTTTKKRCQAYIWDGTKWTPISS